MFKINFFVCFFKSKTAVTDMKNFRKLIPLFALVLGLGLVFTQSAFKNTHTDTLKYRFNGHNFQQLEDADKWDNISEEDEPEGCEPGTELPCIVEFDESTYADIEAFLIANPTVQDMINGDYILSYKDEVTEP